MYGIWILRVERLKGARYGDFGCDFEVNVDGDIFYVLNGRFDRGAGWRWMGCRSLECGVNDGWMR